MNSKNNTLIDKKLYIFDMDGTIYLGNHVFDFAVSFIKKLRKSGRRVLFFTNNASHNYNFYINKLSKMGFEPSADEILSSADVTINFLKNHRNGKKVYLVGTPELHKMFSDCGISMASDDGEADIVVSSFDTTLTYRKLECACRYIQNGAEYLCTHPDFNCPTENGAIPDSGAIAAMIIAATGVTPKYFGKPYADTLNTICEYTGIDKRDMCIFGDRLYTDIAFGKNHGVLSVLVYTGETSPDDVANAPENSKPDIALNSLLDAERIIFG